MYFATLVMFYAVNFPNFGVKSIIFHNSRSCSDTIYS